ncbi:hypothetical protein ACF0H5_015416 [Mactra antiquata]
MYQHVFIVLFAVICIKISAIHTFDYNNENVGRTNKQLVDEFICEEDKYFHSVLGYCLQCKICMEGEYTWFPCTNVTDTICGPKFSPRFEYSAKNIPTETPTSCSSCNYGYNVKEGSNVIYIIEIVAIVILTLSVIISAVIVLHYMICRRSEKEKETPKSKNKLLLSYTDV